ncbi:hypothetical protein HNR46_001444 [Haloferula luteola]|uniref:Uncharacterized protein n=1 Tax=Haloferula luteola TaxID=595692 RepID=A0A840VB96_9BACT|nr:hypothetical protein [Haloferula luteola]MBB5351210.1 hypothetical protein [Haloferula luteola]
MIGKALGMWGLLAMASFGDVEARMVRIRGWHAAMDEGKAVSVRTLHQDYQRGRYSVTATHREFDQGLSSVTLELMEGKHGGYTFHYYYKKGELFLLYVVSESWHFSGGEGETEKISGSRKEDRYYYEDGTCIRQMSRSLAREGPTELASELAMMEQKSMKPDEFAKFYADQAKALLRVRSHEDLHEFVDGDSIDF